MSSGRIEVVCGGMYSGKSEELIRRVKRVQYAKKGVIVFKIDTDIRYDDNNVMTHDGVGVVAIPVANSQQIMDHIKGKKGEDGKYIIKPLTNTNVVAIDEVSLFDDDVVEVVEELANSGFRVIVAGLDQDYKGQTFYIMDKLMGLADDVQKLHAICTNCGEEACRSYRTVQNDERIAIGSIGMYIPLCRKCFNIQRYIDCNKKV